MRFLVDAQLPYTLKVWLNDHGFDAAHTADLPKQNRTTDIEIADLAISEDWIVISKESDFLKLKIIAGKPRRLLLVTTGNIVNSELAAIFERNFAAIADLFKTFEIVEVNNNFVIGRNLE